MPPSDDNHPKHSKRMGKTSGTGTSRISQSKRRYFYAGLSVTGVLAVTAVGITSASASSDSSASSGPRGVTLSSSPLGVDVAPWQTADIVTSSRQRMDRYLRQLGPSIAVRYGGGVFADADNQLIGRNTNVISQAGHQSADFTGRNSRPDALPFSRYASEARTIHANVMVTLNYGTGSPAMARSWFSSIHARHYPVSAVEIGNEPYGCSSPDMEITWSPVRDTSYQPNRPARCPYSQAGTGSAGIKWFARSFLAHGPAFIAAVRRADPAVKIVLPYAISPPRDSGYIWDHMVMSAIHGYAGINVLWYPTRSAASPPAQTELSYLTQIPVRAAAIKADLHRYAPHAFWMIGEENLANQPTATLCRPVTAVFAAASALAWLAQGARNVDWWTASTGNNSNGHCRNRDFSMFDRTGYPQPPFKGFLLASRLAQPHAVLRILNTGNKYVLGYLSTLANGHHAEALINISAHHSERVHGPSIGGGTLTRLQYRSGHATIVTTRVSASSVNKTIDLPIDSVTVWER
jgi:hypothetical protein